MRRKCESCGKMYEAKTARSRFCDAKCRVRASRTRAPLNLVSIDAASKRSTGDAEAGEGTESSLIGVLAATRKELEQASALDSAFGQVAMRIAARLEYVPESGAATAALSRELRAVLEAAKGAAGPQSDRLDEIRRRRDNKFKAAR